MTIFEKVSGPPNCRLHMNLGRYVSNKFECMALSSLRRRLQQLHIPSTPCVCAPVAKMNGVIDCLVCHPCSLSNSSVGGPFFTEHYTARTNILLDEREECGGISVLNLHQEALSCYSFGPPKHPVTFNMPASVVLSFSKFTLINLYFNSGPCLVGTIDGGRWLRTFRDLKHSS